MTTTIDRTATEDTITYAITIDGEQIAYLEIDARTRKIDNVETATEHRGNGYARNLWEAANAEAECFHDLEHHRTAEGDAFANAVGGETINDEDGHYEHCIVCTEGE